MRLLTKLTTILNSQ